MWDTFLREVVKNGKSGGLFVVATLALPTIMVASAWFWRQTEIHGAGAVTISLMVWFLITSAKRRRERRQMEKISPLSHDEIRVARSKLTARAKQGN
jgi:hypothetical protein